MVEPTTFYTEANFEELLAKIPGYTSGDQGDNIVETLRQVAEFVCYSEQNDLNYFDILMSTDVLLTDMPRLLALDTQKINTQLI